MAVFVILENPRNWNLELPGVEVLAARDYLTEPRFSEARRAKVFNLCRRYGYQSLGYYVSLLAEARGHRPMPSVTTLQDLRLSGVTRLVSDELDELMDKSLGTADAGATHTIRVYFGGSPTPGVERLARALFNHFPAPLLEAQFRRETAWKLDGVRPVGTAEIPDEDRPFVAERARSHFRGRQAATASPAAARYDLAILFDPEEFDAPSDEPAIRRFLRAAEALGMQATVIGRDDFSDLAEYDALFIRQTTYVNHYTYRFARQAQAMGLAVIDAPEATMRCTNKVYLAELFARHEIPCPRTVILHRDSDAERIGEALGYPLVLKQPDSSFSQGVRKAENSEELQSLLADFLGKSELVVAQQYLPTAFDWRIGVLDGQFLYGCRYHMAPGHWQIQRSGAGSWRRYGRVEALPLEAIPAGAVDIAVRGAKLIGDGLFGVDVKEIDGRFLVLEVNDNPNIDAGYEDTVLGDELYLRVMRWFLERLERRGLPEGAR